MSHLCVVFVFGLLGSATDHLRLRRGPVAGGAATLQFKGQGLGFRGFVNRGFVVSTAQGGWDWLGWLRSRGKKSTGL